jgi:hypothetical protein
MNNNSFHHSLFVRSHGASVIVCFCEVMGASVIISMCRKSWDKPPQVTWEERSLPDVFQGAEQHHNSLQDHPKPPMRRHAIATIENKYTKMSTR